MIFKRRIILSVTHAFVQRRKWKAERWLALRTRGRSVAHEWTWVPSAAPQGLNGCRVVMDDTPRFTVNDIPSNARVTELCPRPQSTAWCFTRPEPTAPAETRAPCVTVCVHSELPESQAVVEVRDTPKGTCSHTKTKAKLSRTASCAPPQTPLSF